MNIMNPAIYGAEDYHVSRFRCEYLVIGSGPGGSVAAARLAESGKDVILMEEGGHYPTESFTTNPGEMTDRLYRNGGVFPFLGSPTMAFAEGCCAGGGSVINGGLIWRTPPWILDEWRESYGLEGYSQEDLTPHFETVERDLHVQRHSPESPGNLDSIVLTNGADKLGWKWVWVPRAIKGCINENLCPTGCMEGAKQSMLQTYIPRALSKGARLFSDCRAVKIRHSGGIAHSVQAVARGATSSKETSIQFDHLFVAGGSVQTPHLLKRSGLSRKAGQKLEFHFNLKIVALFENELFAEEGTIFTTQVQEFERDGILICASNLRPGYVAMTLSHFGNEVINHVLADYARSAIYVAMTRPKSKAHIMSNFGDHPFVRWRFEPDDFEDAKSALRYTAEVLFASGATELYMPIGHSGPVHSNGEAQDLLAKTKPGQLELITVHAMASCSMGPNQSSSVVDLDGRLWNMKNVIVADASVLPSNVGESPQGTIMAVVHEIMNRHLGA